MQCPLASSSAATPAAQVCLGGVPLEAQKQAPLDARVQRIVTSVKELQVSVLGVRGAVQNREAAV
eukprot:1161904-Pelagomonas_calceolata.AAC.16